MSSKSSHKSRPASSSLEEIQDALSPLAEAPQDTAIFLDLDGTLAPITAKPDTVAIPGSISKLIRRIQHRFLAVTVVTGRPATEAKRIVGSSEMAYIGNHGFEIMIPGHAVVISEEAQPFLSKIRELSEFCRSLNELTETGILVEDKMATVSLHYRRAPNPEAARQFIQEKIMPRVKELQLHDSQGRMVIEIKPPVNVDKGVSVGRLLDRLGARQAFYMGDDTTDIDALKELRRRKKDQDSAMVGVGVISDEMPADLAKHADLLVDRSVGVEMVLEILLGEKF